MFLIPKQATNVAKAASKDKTRYALNGVHVSFGQAEGECNIAATNGRALVRLSVPRDEEAVARYIEGNAGGGFEATNDKEMKALVPAKAFGELGKRLPTSKLGDFSKIAIDDADATDTTLSEKVSFFGTDGESAGTVELKQLSGAYPDYQELIPATDDGRLTVRVNPKILRETLAVVESLNEKTGVVLSFARNEKKLDSIDSGAPVVIRASGVEDSTVTALVMPMAIDA